MYSYASLLASSRKNNQDRAEVFERGDVLVVLVADGAGGMRGGAAASDAVVSAVASAVLDPGFDVHDVQNWMNLLANIDHQFASATTGETTAVIAVVGHGSIVGVSSGNSQAWLVTETGIDDLTARQNKKRLGSGRAVPISFYRPRLEGTLVVGSDGLFNYAAMKKIADVVPRREPAEVAEVLRALVQLPSGRYQDDVGVVVVARVARGAE